MRTVNGPDREHGVALKHFEVYRRIDLSESYECAAPVPSVLIFPAQSVEFPGGQRQGYERF